MEWKERLEEYTLTVMHTDRLNLRPFVQEDLADLHEYSKSPKVGKSAGLIPHKDIRESEKVLRQFIDNDFVWAMVKMPDGKVIGAVQLCVDDKRQNLKARTFGCVTSEDYWGMGLGVEALRAVVRYAFEELEMDIVSTYCCTFNERSRRMINRCGFVLDGILRMAGRTYDGEQYDEECYSMTRKEYLKLASNGHDVAEVI